jgi:hypothetical protein
VRAGLRGSSGGGESKANTAQVIRSSIFEIDNGIECVNVRDVIDAVGKSILKNPYTIPEELFRKYRLLYKLNLCMARYPQLPLRGYLPEWTTFLPPQIYRLIGPEFQ